MNNKRKLTQEEKYMITRLCATTSYSLSQLYRLKRGTELKELRKDEDNLITIKEPVCVEWMGEDETIERIYFPEGEKFIVELMEFGYTHRRSNGTIVYFPCFSFSDPMQK